MTVPPTAPTHLGLPSCAEVDLDAITANVVELDRRAGAAGVMAVVKADGYGHGLLASARAALRGGAVWLGVAQLGEALALRESGIQTPVLAWLLVPGQDFGRAIELSVDLSVATPWAIDAVAVAARGLGVTARVQLKVDTGLGRNGAFGADFTALVERARELEAEGAVVVTGIWSHFAYADAPDHPTVRAQQESFAAAVAEGERAGLRPEVRHLANSAATLTNPSAHFDLVRPGLAVYGLSPVPDLGGPSAYGLREAMRLTARLASVKDYPAGGGVSYGHQYHPEVDTRLGLVPMGYADGIPRTATNLGPMQVAGERFRVAGRVCMDQVVLDLGAQTGAQAGDEVVVFGREADGEPTAQDWAVAVDTINYEIVTRVGSRVPRVYVGEGS